MNNIVMYATTSGNSKIVADIILERSKCDNATVLNISKLDKEDYVISDKINTVIAITPTYGLGLWHYAWEKRFNCLIPFFQTAERVMLVGLGDARGHGKTFAGGIGIMARRLNAIGVNPIGSVVASDYSFKSSEAVLEGKFPGLVLDFRNDRRKIHGKVDFWMTDNNIFL